MVATRTWLRQDAQIAPSNTFTDTLSPGSTMQSSSTDIEYDLNTLRSQVKRVLNYTAGAWYDDVPTINAKKRSIYQLGDHLDQLEEHKFLFRAQILTDIVVPAAVAATGAMIGVAGTNLIDGETFTLSDGIHAAVVFEFDDNSSVLPGNIAVAFVSGDTASQVATAMKAAINGAANFDMTASGSGSNVVLTNDTKGSHGNITITTTVADAGFVAGKSGMAGGAGDARLLVVANSETPSEVAAIGTDVSAGTGNGAVVVSLGAGVIGRWSSAFVLGPNAINPRNLVVIRDASTDDPILSGGKEVFGLLQAQSGVVDGDAFDDTTKKVQISFVREAVGGGHTLEHVPADDIGGKTINYMYTLRQILDNLPETVFLSGVFIDQSASVDVTLNNAIDNQSGPATQSQNIEWRIDDARTLKFQDSTGGYNLLSIVPNAGNDLVEFTVDNWKVTNTNTAEFTNGVKVDSGGTTINLGATAGQIDAAGLTVASTGANDLKMVAGQAFWMTDSYRAGSTWSLADGIKLANSSAEWTDFETVFGEVSLLAAITAASQAGGHDKRYAVCTANIPADTNVTGAGGTPNIDTQLFDYSGLTFMSDVNVFLNGQLLRPGADAAANNDYYPGTTPANGDLKFEFGLKGGGSRPDVITMEVFTKGL